MHKRLPRHPDLGQLRRQAKELKVAAQAGDQAALDRIHAHLPATPIRLSAAQLAIAREYGFNSWAGLKKYVERRTFSFPQQVEFFLDDSASSAAKAAAFFADHPDIARYSFRTAVVLGEATHVQDLLAADPGLATRPDPRSGWPPLLDACRSVWHRIDPGRAGGLVTVARLLLDAGADPNTAVATGWSSPTHLSALRAAVGVHSQALTRLLLERGARPDHGTLHNAAFTRENACLRLLLEHTTLPADSTALEGPISLGNTEGVRLLLLAGADPNLLLPGYLFREPYDEELWDDTWRPRAGDAPIHPLSAAVEVDAPPELIELLLQHNAYDGSATGLAMRYGKTEIANLLERSMRRR